MLKFMVDKHELVERFDQYIEQHRADAGKHALDALVHSPTDDMRIQHETQAREENASAQAFALAKAFVENLARQVEVVEK